MASLDLPKVDVNLFVDAAYKGTMAGKADPGPFASFVGGLTQGIDDQQKWESEQQQQVIRQNQIEQIPVTNRIHEAEALKDEAQVAGFKEDPATFTALQVQKAKTDLLLQQQEAALAQKESSFIDLMKNGSSADKTNALIGGENADLFAQKPHLYDYGIKASATFDPQDRMKIVQVETQKVRADSAARYNAQAQAKLGEVEDAYVTNGDINALAAKVGVTPYDLALHGEVRTQTQLPQRPKPQLDDKGVPVLDANKNPVYVRDSNGDLVTEDDPVAAAVPGVKLGTRQVFYYGEDPNNRKPVEFTLKDKTSELYNKYRTPFLSKYTFGKDQGGMGDAIHQGAQIDKQKEAEAEAQRQAAEEKNRDWNSMADFYGAGANVAQVPQKDLPPSMARAQSIEAKRTPTPQSTAAPKQTFDPSTVEHSVYVAPTITPTPTATGTPQEAPDQTPQGRPTPAMTPTPAAQQTPPATETANPQAAFKRRQEEAAARARFNLEKQKPMSDVPAQAQATQTTAPGFIPARFEIQGGIQPHSETVERVNSIPELAGFSALSKAVVAVESAGRANAVSPTGVKGLMQVTQDTANSIQPGLDRSNPGNSIFLGTAYLEKLMDQFQNPLIALVGYNAGPAVAARAIKIAGTTDWDKVKVALPQAIREFYPNNPGKVKETMEYVPKVLSYFSAFTNSRRDMAIAQDLKSRGALRWA